MKLHSVGLFNRNISQFDRLLGKIPLTYWGILKTMVGSGFQKILDVGCGTGLVMSMINDSRRLEATGLDIYAPYLKECKKRGIFKRLVKQDVRKIPFKDREFEVVICLHVVEHINKQEGIRLIKKLEKIASKRVILAMPIGKLPQAEYDGNIYQTHKSTWYPRELRKMGYKVVGQGLGYIYRDRNVVLMYGKFAYIAFFISTLFQPLLYIRPDLGCYMICRKNIG